MKFSMISRQSVMLLGVVPALTLVFSCNNPEAEKSATDSTQTTVAHDHTLADTSSVPLVKHAEAVLAGTYADTTVSGTAKFDADDNGKVKLTLEVTIPAKAGKSVAVHLHEHGDCGDNGKMSHGHWNPTNQQHGKWGSASFHLGDIGNVQLDAQGKGTLTMETDLWTLGGTADKNILNKAVIVHGGVDDYTTQPTGNAGSRIGCGVIK